MRRKLEAWNFENISSKYRIIPLWRDRQAVTEGRHPTLQPKTEQEELEQIIWDQEAWAFLQNIARPTKWQLWTPHPRQAPWTMSPDSQIDCSGMKGRLKQVNTISPNKQAQFINLRHCGNANIQKAAGIRKQPTTSNKFTTDNNVPRKTSALTGAWAHSHHTDHYFNKWTTITQQHHQHHKPQAKPSNEHLAWGKRGPWFLKQPDQS